ncbi:GNAT family N-acetyltransferase [Alloyangia pacifica]|uniref:Acetyltransferase (GNAT) domain-containing protein n=1 Tax=Alloyangia pacifica TaxID=311180 RepID=A0A1I6PW80_9RHOB|nr:GNAT family N-acetyltransferase [Alloyangia pacifica]SDG36803.1 Acetyltransferase (GNAT) domain-containing protein [Alloyangia pacifica]SFS44305.1 Acetyltransferase (GNAT) domain-containing protein [Alloyangia pacifica]
MLHSPPLFSRPTPTVSRRASSPLLPLPQSPHYARACSLIGVDCRAGQQALPGGEVLHWQTQSRRMPLLGTVSLLSRGPVASSPVEAEGWLRERRGTGPLLLNADGLSADALRRAGFWPLLTPATLGLLAIGPEAQMRGALRQKWRNRLARAEDAGLTLRRMPLLAKHWLLAAEAAQARARRYRNLPPGMLVAFARANPGCALIWEAQQGRLPVAAIAVLRHGRMASWTTGVSTPRGRAVNAMNLLVWEAMRWLAAQGHELLDLGILNDADAPGVTQFKLGTGARSHRLGGTWLRTRSLAPLARHLPKGLAT